MVNGKESIRIYRNKISRKWWKVDQSGGQEAKLGRSRARQSKVEKEKEQEQEKQLRRASKRQEAAPENRSLEGWCKSQP